MGTALNAAAQQPATAAAATAQQTAAAQQTTTTELPSVRQMLCNLASKVNWRGAVDAPNHWGGAQPPNMLQAMNAINNLDVTGKLSAPSSKKLSEIAVESVVAAVSTVTGPRGPDDPPFVLGSSLPHLLSSALTAFAALLSVIVVWLTWTRGDEVAKLQDGFDANNTPCTLAAWAMRALGLTHDELPPEVLAVSDKFRRDFIPVSTMHRKDADGPMHGPGGALSLLAVTQLGGTVVDGQGALN